jgi:alpha-glucosidase
MIDVLRFWLDRGIDGFRIDALRQVIKDDQWRDNPPNPDWTGDPNNYRSQIPVHNTDQPEVLDVVREFRALTDAYAERVLIGELYLPIERLVRYYGDNGNGLHLPFNFHLILTAWDARAIGALVHAYEAALPPGAWPNWVLGNHDQPRVASRIGAPQARVAAMLLLTLRGTPTLYQGEEIGMHDVAVPESDRQDPVGRDPERTPMQWDATEYAGFSTAIPWLPLAPDAATVNVESQRDDPRSMLSLYRALIDLRRASDALAVGSYRQVHVDDNVLVYDREHGGQRVRIALNLSNAPQALPVALADGTRILLSTHLDEPSQPDTLRANEGRILAWA